MQVVSLRVRTVVVHISSVPPVPGKFYRMTPTQLRSRPWEFGQQITAQFNSVPIGKTHV